MSTGTERSASPPAWAAPGVPVPAIPVDPNGAAVTVRDRGRVIPGCTNPPTRTEAHHLTDWADGGTTDIDKLALVCPFHHDHIDGWTLHLRHGRV